MDFAINHKNQTIDGWKKVIRSEKTKFNRLGSDGQPWMQKQSEEILNDKQAKGTVKCTYISPMIWGCITLDIQPKLVGRWM